jgi:hypothetical protein
MAHNARIRQCSESVDVSLPLPFIETGCDVVAEVLGGASVSLLKVCHLSRSLLASIDRDTSLSAFCNILPIS